MTGLGTTAQEELVTSNLN